MTAHEIAEVAEIVELLRRLPPEIRKEVYFIAKGALMVADKITAA